MSDGLVPLPFGDVEVFMPVILVLYPFVLNTDEGHHGEKFLARVSDAVAH